ncbi:phosphate signaling complex protein PhoU [Corynebacterium sp. 23_3061]|uniref:phosphate signaling complex protein PhoU n=1 Tax=Corynebacterium kroppenstedtii TaxID=161879 RepID=UPI0019577165|nr:phosphate signaling complex protein PhoU [Corynebacterium kroppenstedtii]QRQ65206.1 phosphate signaling complex protein PhoU [Corynebacterium kroppenstedtii]
MRDDYREHLAEFAHNLIVMCDSIKEMASHASRALLSADLTAAEDVLTSVEDVEELRGKCEQQAFQLLALESPVARDLRRVISGTYIVEDLSRMSALMVHIAKVARRRHPDCAVPESMVPYFSEMAKQCLDITATLHDVLVSHDPELALQLARDDDAIDDLHHHIFVLTTQREWPYTTTNAVDVTLLSRYYERYSDHAVQIGARVIYLATGMRPEEYVGGKDERDREATFTRHFDEIQQRYGGTF